MSTVARNTRRYSRGKQTTPSGDVLSQVFDRFGHLLVTRDHGKGAPSYREGEAAAIYEKTVATAVLPGSPNASAPTAANIFDLAAFGGLCLYWKPAAVGGTTHTDIDVAVWALTDNGAWVRVAVAATLLPYVELNVSGTGYRAVFVEVTAVNGGADGDLVLSAAGD